MTIFFLVVFLLYFLVVGFLWTGWRRALSSPVKESKERSETFISVIVPVRNEEANISRLLDSLLAQHFNMFEIIIVNDHSEDRTVEVVKQSIDGKRNVRLIDLSNESGKKKAIARGVTEAKGDVIVTTDADCIVPENWLIIIDKYFQTENTKMVFGGVRIETTRNFFSSLQALEFSSLVGSGAATLSLGYPSMCNGANLAFRKSVFEEVKGFEGNFHIASGDDEFLLRKIVKRYPKGVKFLNNPESVVATQPLPDLRSFLRQRIRWAGKWRLHKQMFSKLLALFILFFHVIFILFLSALIMNQIDLTTSLALLSFKVLLEAFFLRYVTSFLHVRWNWFAFTVLQLSYSFYIILVGLISNFQAVEWKNRIVPLSKKLTTSDQ